jgi:hypothetical protein
MIKARFMWLCHSEPLVLRHCTAPLVPEPKGQGRSSTVPKDGGRSKESRFR